MSEAAPPVAPRGLTSAAARRHLLRAARRLQADLEREALHSVRWTWRQGVHAALCLLVAAARVASAMRAIAASETVHFVYCLLEAVLVALVGVAVAWLRYRRAVQRRCDISGMLAAAIDEYEQGLRESDGMAQPAQGAQGGSPWLSALPRGR